jgi:hypothetical protein
MDFIFEIHGLSENETATTRDRNLMSGRENGNHRYTPASDFSNKTIFN